MLIIRFFISFLTYIVVFIFLTSCNSLQLNSKGNDVFDCGGIDFNESWFYEWEKTVQCSDVRKNKDSDKYLFQRMNFIAAEAYFLKNNIKKASEKFFLSLEGPDCNMSKAAQKYLVIMNIPYDNYNNKLCENNYVKDDSIFGRYIYILSTESDKTKNIEDEFYALYSIVLGSKTPPLLYNIAISALKEKKLDKTLNLFNNIISNFPYLTKVVNDRNQLNINNSEEEPHSFFKTNNFKEDNTDKIARRKSGMVYKEFADIKKSIINILAFENTLMVK